MSLIDAQTLHEQQDQATLIDIRQPGEFRLDGHLDASTNIAAYDWQHGFYTPREEFAEEVLEVCDPADRIVLLCADGRLSVGARSVLESHAFTDVSVLDGGLNEWQAEELPGFVVDEDGEGGLVGAWV
jgi:rhodanese-related sulfurtransferase